MRIPFVEIDQNPDGCQQFLAGRRLVSLAGRTLLTEEHRRIVAIAGVRQRLTRKSGLFQGFQIRVLFEDGRLVQGNCRHPRVNAVHVRHDGRRY